MIKAELFINNKRIVHGDIKQVQRELDKWMDAFGIEKLPKTETSRLNLEDLKK